MDFILLSRMQFAATTIFHYIFAPLTLGRSLLVAIVETGYVRTGGETCLAMAKFWGKIFLINVGLGVVTGLTLEFQFGTNWGAFSVFVLSSFFVMSLSASHLLKKQHAVFFEKSFEMALIMGLLLSIFVVVEGEFHGVDVAEKQPSKVAVMESLWETTPRAPVYLFAGAVHFGMMGLFPRLLPSAIDAAFSLTTSNSASEPFSLKIMLIIVSIFIPLVLICQGYAYSIFRHPVTASEEAC